MSSTYSVCADCSAVNRVNLETALTKKPVCGKCGKAIALHGAVSEVSASGLNRLVQKSPLPVVVDFWAPWCGPCRVFAPTFEAASKDFAGQVVFAKLNTEAHPLAGDAFGIRGIPTLILFKGGLEAQRQSGAMPIEAFRTWLGRSLV